MRVGHRGTNEFAPFRSHIELTESHFIILLWILLAFALLVLVLILFLHLNLILGLFWIFIEQFWLTRLGPYVQFSCLFLLTLRPIILECLLFLNQLLTGLFLGFFSLLLHKFFVSFVRLCFPMFVQLRLWQKAKQACLALILAASKAIFDFLFAIRLLVYAIFGLSISFNCKKFFKTFFKQISLVNALGILIFKPHRWKLMICLQRSVLALLPLNAFKQRFDLIAAKLTLRWARRTWGFTKHSIITNTTILQIALYFFWLRLHLLGLPCTRQASTFTTTWATWLRCDWQVSHEKTRLTYKTADHFVRVEVDLHQNKYV